MSDDMAYVCARVCGQKVYGVAHTFFFFFLTLCRGRHLSRPARLSGGSSSRRPGAQTGSCAGTLALDWGQLGHELPARWLFAVENPCVAPSFSKIRQSDWLFCDFFGDLFLIWRKHYIFHISISGWGKYKNKFESNVMAHGLRWWQLTC